ncbi:MAG: hypothetical protein ACE5H3_00715 [Planctomycetota bacterium]
MSGVPGGLSSSNAPSFRLVQTHFLVGILGFLVFSFLLVLKADSLQGHFFQPVLLGLTHTCVLLWFLPIAQGALLQLVPVLFQVRIRSEGTAWIALAFLFLGASGMAGHLWIYETHWGLPFSAALLALGLLLYVLNLLATLSRATSLDLTGVHVIAALFHLLLAAGLGLALAWNLWNPFLLGDHLEVLKAHAHLAGLGFFGLLVMGMVYRMLEMFLLAYKVRPTFGWVSFLAANLGLCVLLVDFLFGRAPFLTAIGASCLVVAILAFTAQVVFLLRARFRRNLEAAWWHSLASVFWLLVAAAEGAALFLPGLDRAAHDRLALAYAVAAFLGFVGSIIVGQLYKIVPFLVWLERFSPYLGLKEIPAAGDLLPRDLSEWQWVAMQTALLQFTLALLLGLPWLLSMAAVFFAVSALAFAAAVGRVYLCRP